MARIKLGSAKATTTILTTNVDLATADVTGVLPVANGGTGQGSYTNGQLLIGNTTGNTLTKASLTGTADQVVVTPGAGSITLSTPQSINTTSSPTFAGLTLTSGLTYANMQNVSATQRILGRKTVLSGVIEEMSITDIMDFMGTSQGAILYRSGSAWGQLLKPSVTGQVLVGGDTPAWTGGMSLLATSTPSSSSSVDFNFTNWTNADFIAYLVKFENLAPATNSVALWVRTSADGTTFDSGATNYGWTNVDFGTGSFSSGDAQIKIAGTTTGLSNTSGDGTSGSLWIELPSATAKAKLTGDCAAKGASQIRRQTSSGERLSSAAVLGVRLMFSSGNIASGEVRLFGLGKS